ncbi:hypothetical protein [Parasphingopyxis sp.]|uniref:hypothetical protein n=1 Tax=Parasphingopyxis sp. TaxID=1920299 RepID=UPI00262951F8|nr:hypothetical protein [Parasphingopyxis sp.]
MISIVGGSVKFFGDETQACFAELATQESSGDGETNAGEPFTLAGLGIVSIDLTTSSSANDLGPTFMRRAA